MDFGWTFAQQPVSEGATVENPDEENLDKYQATAEEYNNKYLKNQ